MAQKAPILLYQEAQATLVNTINYFIQQGVPSYEIQQIVGIISADLSKLVEQELAQAQQAYQQAVEEEIEKPKEEIEAV